MPEEAMGKCRSRTRPWYSTNNVASGVFGLGSRCGCGCWGAFWVSDTH